MSATPFDLLTSEVLTDADVVNGLVYVSPDQNNSPYQPNLRLVADYVGMSPADGSFSLQALVEGKASNGQYYPMAPQNDPFYGFFDQKREIVADAAMFWPDAGIDNLIQVGNVQIARISPVQVTLPDVWRVCIHATAEQPGATLGSVTISLYGEVYT